MIGWQDLAALCVVVVALAYLGRLALQAVRATGKVGCGTGCGSCPSRAGAKGAPREVVTLGPPPKKG